MSERWEPAKMNRFSAKVMEKARERARAMIADSGDSQLLDLGEQKEALMISTRPEAVIGSETFEIEGKTIYIGIPAENI